ncbi:hypothetical protein PF010_g17424 [Phytophthora fragariae]|uniref:Protein kinase domain-containing protein n=1 Tax=Phytophthora fragariae TaxID=53985 RepID=A0A6A3EAH5_9STRA|nr:hypothetical protein PF009_g19244 [Phytophthora fragariae]KAE9093583.1 hypothetical protein PF010_g17424 [Phytophthora fragariae]
MRKSSLAELLADHRRQEAAEEAAAVSSDRAATSPASPPRPAPTRSSSHAAEAAQAQERGVFPPRPRPRRRYERAAKHRMERVYEEVSRRKSQSIAGPAAPRGSSETDSSATPPTSDAPLPAAADGAATGSSDGLRCTYQAQIGEGQQQGAEEQSKMLMPRPKDRKRPRGGVRRVEFATPPPAAVSGSSSGQNAGNRHAGMLSAGDYRQQDDEDERRRERQLERRRRRQERANRRRSSSEEDKGATLLDVDDATVQYIDAVLVKPDPQVFNKYTRFFLDPKLETLYQDFTAIYWFGRARWHVGVWMAVHVFVNLVFYVLPSSGFTGMDQFILSYDSLPTILQWIYIPIALPFAALPNKYNPFQTRWRSWVCLIIIFFNLAFQVWLADASRLATNAYTTVVLDYLSCEASNSELSATFEGFDGSSDEPLSNDAINNALAYLNDEQRNLAISVTHMCSDALVQTLVGFASLFSFLFVISIRLEFVQVVVVAVTGGAIYAIVVSAFGLQLQWLITFAYGMAVVLLLILSYSSDRTNRRSFLSNFLVEKENENLKSSLKQAEAALQNDAAHADEERAVARILAAPEMRHLEMVHIPFADLTFLQAIGRGSMGDVIKARYFGTIVVCKRMRREHIVESGGGQNRNGNRNVSNGDSALASFRDEIELMSCLRHPNIVQFIGASWDNASNLCIVMEYLENGDMHSVLHSGLGKNFTWADPLLKMAVDAVQELETRRTPYHDQEETGLKVLMRVAHKGLRPSLPSTCLPERRKLIEDCLRDIPAHRPTFAQVLSRLQGPVLLEIEGHVAAQPDVKRRVLLRRYQERRSL